MRQGLMTVATVALAVLGACGSSGSSRAQPDGSTTTRAATSAGVAQSPTGPGNSETVRVDITITGSSTATIKGSKGTCRLSPTLGNSYSFEGADYPELGPNGAFSLTSDTRLGTQIEGPTIKLIVGPNGYLTGSDVSGIDINPERTAVNLNQTITSSTGGGPPQTVRVSGTIRCQ